MVQVTGMNGLSSLDGERFFLPDPESLNDCVSSGVQSGFLSGDTISHTLNTEKGAHLCGFFCVHQAEELKLDEALLTVSNHLPDAISLYYVSDYCYQCLFQPLLTVSLANSSVPVRSSVTVSTRFTLTIGVIKGSGNKEPVCSWRQLYGEHGEYIVSVRSSLDQKNGTVQCDTVVDKPPSNAFLPLLLAFIALLSTTGSYYLTAYIFRLGCTQRFVEDLNRKTSYIFNKASDDTQEQKVEVHKSRRLLSLDTFRGFSLSVMVFVNYGGGEYWFFQHAPWNGLTIADLVMPWFVLIVGTSVALAFSSMMKRGVGRLQLLRKLTWRTLVLTISGVFFLNYGPADGPLSWRWARIPGVLQRLGFTYFVIALMHTCFGKQSLESVESHQWSAAVRDIVAYWPEWIIIVALETISLCLTFLLPVPGCPTGYLGPGGIGDYGRYANCTGGAAGYIDKWLLGANHIYQHPTCVELYKTTEPFDPEGILGTINSVVMAFFGLQAGKIVLGYRKFPLKILKRFMIWSILLGVISAILTKCTRDEGFIPINKNLWSLSFVTTLSCFSFILLGLMFYVIDVRHWWRGQPFIYPGMNSIFVFVGHSLLASYFPFNWEVKYWTSHYEFLAQDLLGTSIWILVAYLLYRQKFFLKI
ncbi:heparan-alpha-glucosaminide N-acetyltransferase-like [Hyperolius riggenbachi]|uniref:heparan-alpha-glucosaminide N-acetyltransferase-like n=1 Tax=Hyperolius riggenbachi TaxID=752182 RepID=UPI0035A2DD0A